MSVFANLYTRKPGAATLISEGRGMRDADAAIRDARAGRISVSQMLRSVLGAQVLVPLADPPVMDGKSIARWKPATVTKQATGGQFLVAFTDESLVSAFSKDNPDHSFAFLVDTLWILDVLPPDHGIAFNVGGNNGFEWPAEGISAYKAER